MKKLLFLAAALCLLAFAGTSDSQTGEYRTIILSGTADILIDSTLTTTYMNDKRCYINGVYWWYDNAANTNNINVEIVSGRAAMATQGLQRQWKYAEAMTSSGITGKAFVPNITTIADSTVYFEIQATGSDSLFMAINYRFVGK